MRTKSRKVAHIPTTRRPGKSQPIESNGSESSDGASSIGSQHVQETADPALLNNNEGSNCTLSNQSASIHGSISSKNPFKGQEISQAIVAAGPQLLSLPKIVEALEKKVIGLEAELAKRDDPQEELDVYVAKLEALCNGRGLVDTLNALLDREAQVEVQEEAMRRRIAKLNTLDNFLEARGKLFDKALQKVQRQKKAAKINQDDFIEWLADFEKDRTLWTEDPAKWARERDAMLEEQNSLPERKLRRARAIPGRSLRPLSDAAILKHGCTIEILPNGSIKLERNSGVPKELLPALYRALKSWKTTKPTLLTAEHLPGKKGKSCIDRTVIRRTSDWTSKDRAYACRMCAKFGRPCCRFVGEDLVVLPLHPDVRDAELGKGDIRYWTLEQQEEDDDDEADDEEGDKEVDDEEEEQDDEEEVEEESPSPKRRCTRNMGKRN